MTMMTTIVGVALGLTPVQTDGTVQPISDGDARIIGRFSETVDDTGTTHLKGVDRRNGEAFHITGVAGITDEVGGVWHGCSLIRPGVSYSRILGEADHHVIS